MLMSSWQSEVLETPFEAGTTTDAVLLNFTIVVKITVKAEFKGGCGKC